MLRLVVCLLILVSTGRAVAAGRVLVVVGPSSHPPGSHEVAAGARLVKHCLETSPNVSGLTVDVVHEWPGDAAVRERADTVLFTGDTFPPARMKESSRIMADMASMAARGCGVVCIHYATGLRADDMADDGEHPLLHWTGGYFATRNRHHQSVAKIFEATITPGEGDHPVLRGWRSFTLVDEPYYNNYFGRGGPAPGVVALATSMLPPDAPKKEVVAWGIQRPDGGRGMGIVMPHFFRSWKNDDLRKCILNGIVWTAKVEVPPDGVQSKLPDDLMIFEPAALEPQPKPAKTK